MTSSRMVHRAPLALAVVLSLVPTGARADDGAPAMLFVGSATFAAALLWAVPVQWMVVRRMAPSPAARAFRSVVLMKLGSLVGGAIPLYFAWALCETALRRIGVSDLLLTRAFLLRLGTWALDVPVMLAWLGIAYLATSAVESAILRFLWRDRAVDAEPRTVAWRSNGVVFVGLGITSAVFTTMR